MNGIKKRVKRRLPLVVIFSILVVGLAVLLYPTVSNLISQYTAHTDIYIYNTTVNQLDTTEIDNLYKQAEDYNKALAEKNSEILSSVSYENLLSVTDAIGYIDIPQLNIYLPIYHGTEDDVLKNGVGHMIGTSLPVGGAGTHSVLAAHTGLPTAELFTSIDRLVIGDVFYIHVLGRILAYKVNQVKVVLPEEDSDIQIVSGEDYLTLLTCTPYGINDHRLLVRGTRIPYTEDDEQSNVSPTSPKEEEMLPIETIIWFWGSVAVISVIVIILLILFLPVGRKRNNRQIKP